jgi:hypothetical protein
MRIPQTMPISGERLILTASCVACEKGREMIVKTSHYNDWLKGAMAQHAFPYLSDEHREMLISGMCPDCWNETFPPEQDELV